MRDYYFNHRGFRFKRITKKRARVAYENGLDVMFCACNMRPGEPYNPQCTINKRRIDLYNNDFNSVVNVFELYNCINSETGKYTAFYIPVEPVEGMEWLEQYNYKYMEGVNNGTI